ncbi:cancer-associated gene 1 protein [Perognathus longimembris pacificus]|uniref:cancer-associated gene 1 protein n=1 Tax=Perognathus longimembris pacificus TaxID=214514 RepID=UPI00201869E4|nr:cancer-associated gene 1 protein [Perognathus longimembris pacificus]
MDHGKTFNHSANRNKDSQIFWTSSLAPQKKKRILSSPGDPTHSEVGTSGEKLESMSESDAMNVSGHSQDLSHSDSLFCMEARPVTLDLPQNEIKNIKMENESTPTFSEDIYSIQDNLLSRDVNIGNYPQNVQMEPINSSISSSRQFEPICKFHWIEEFYDDTTTFQNIIESLSCTENSELQNHGYHYAKETDIKQDSLEEENPMETCLSANKDQPAYECINQSPENPSVTYYNKETLPFIEHLQAECTVKESAINPSQLQCFLDKGNVPRNVENAFCNENGFKLLDLRVNYKTEETEVSSKEIQNSRDVSHQEEVTVAGVENIGIAISSSPVGNPRNGLKHCLTPALGQDIETLWPLEEDLALNEVLKKLKHTNRKQLLQIQDLQYQNEHLGKQVKELQTKITKQQTFVDIISKLKENIEELIEDKYNVMLEKSDTNKKLQNLQEIFSDTQKHLQETKKEKETLQLQLKKIKANYLHLQESFLAEMQEKNFSVDQCIEMDKTLCKKEEEIKSLQQLKGELEMATTSALDLLEREKETREQELLTLQEEFQKQEKESLREKRKLKLKVEKLIMQVKNLLFTCEHEKAKNTKLQQHIDGMKNENAELQQQIRRCEEQNCVPKFEISKLMGQLEDAMEPDITKATKKMPSNLCLNCEEDSLNPSDVRETLQMQTSKIHSLLTLVVGLLTCQDISNPDGEHFKESEKVSNIMLKKLKSIQHRKKELEKQLLKHKDKIAMLRELIAREKTFQDHMTEGADFDSNEANDSRDTSFLLAAKLDKYHNLNEELDFLITKLGGLLESKEDHYSRLIEENAKYRRHVGNLINKVTSYEEIIKCADQRLEISHSQIAHLEERNRHLEDLIRTPKEKARKPRSRLENRPKSMTLVISK